MGNTVSLCMICKNEENNIGHLMEDVCPVLEEVWVVDTGSTDKTLEILEGKRKKYPNLKIGRFEWVSHFSKARNYSFSLAEKSDTEWMFWLDGDDRVDAEKLRDFKDNRLDNPDVDAWMLDYIYSTLPDGSPRTILGRERFVRKSKNPRWIGAIHETIDISRMRQHYSKDLQIVHNHGSKFIEPRRNLKILEEEFKKNPRDARTAYYLGKELFDHIDPRSKEILEHYLTLPGRYFDDECNARSRLARTYLAEGRHGDAIRCINEVYHLDITRRRADFYFIYGAVEEDLQNYEMAIEWYKRCLMKPPEGTRVLTMEFYTWHPRKRLAECYKALGDWNNAFDYADEVAGILPDDRNTEEWLKGIRSLRVRPRDGHKLATLEFGTEVRYDSYRVHKENVPLLDADGNPSTANLGRGYFILFYKRLPLADSCLDGIVVGKFCSLADDEIARIVKPGGFVWSERPIRHDDLGFLGSCGYQKTKLCNYVKVDDSKPVIAYDNHPVDDFAPYRYRITNLVKSAVKNGHRVVDYSFVDPKKYDVLVTLSLSDKHKAFKDAVHILDVTEKLPSYSRYGIEKADVVNASSPMLAEYIRQKHPDLKVVNVDDHFEMPPEGWL